MKLLILLASFALVGQIVADDLPAGDDNKASGDIKVSVAQKMSPELKLLCKGKFIPIYERSTLLALYDELVKLPPQTRCKEEVRKALIDFGPILKDSETNVCSMQMAKTLKKLFYKHLNTSPLSRKYYNPISIYTYYPMTRSLRNFILAFGMQVATSCNQNMFNVLMDDTDNLLTDDDVAKLGSVARDDGVFGKLLDRLNDPGQIILPSDILAVMSTGDGPIKELQKFHVKTKHAKEVRRLKYVCAKRFRPVYEPLIMPITILASVGFNYKASKLLAEFNEKENSMKIKRISRIVTICEAAKLLEPVDWVDEDELGSEATAVSKKGEKVPQVLKLLTKEEANEIMSKLDKPDEIGGEPLEEAAFEVPGVKLGDLGKVYLYDDEELVHAMRSIRLGKSAARRAKAEMHGKAWKLSRQNLADGKLKLTMTAPIKAVFKSLFNKLTRKNNDEKDVLALVDKMVAKISKGEFDYEGLEDFTNIVARQTTIGIGVFGLSMITLIILHMIMASLGLVSSG